MNFPVVGGGTALVFSASLAGTSILATDFVPLGLLGIGKNSVFIEESDVSIIRTWKHHNCQINVSWSCILQSKKWPMLLVNHQQKKICLSSKMLNDIQVMKVISRIYAKAGQDNKQ